MICEDISRFQIYYDYIKGVKPLYDKSNSIVWLPYCEQLKKGIWGFPKYDHNGIYQVPMNLISPYYLKRYIDRKLSMLNSTIMGTIYIPFCFFAERLNVGILLEKRNDNYYSNGNMLPAFLEDFEDIFPQKESISFC